MRFRNSIGIVWAIFIVTIVKSLGFHSLQLGRQLSFDVPRFDLLINSRSMTISRRSKKQKSLHASDKRNEAGKSFYTDQFALTKLYRGVSMLHFGQIIMAFKKSGVTLGCFNFIGGPLMAAGLMLILGNAAEKQHLGNDTFKRLNGLMVLYSTMALCLVALVPQIHNPLGLLFLVSGSSSLSLGVRGYFAGLRADNNKKIFPETQRLLEGASKTSLALPPKSISFGDFCSLWTVAIRKAALVWGIAQVLLSPRASARLEIAPRLSQLMKLTILGGSLVTTISIKDSISRYDAAVPLTMLASYVFFTMAAFEIANASKPIEVVEGLIFSFCAMSSAVKGIRNIQTQKNMA